MSIWGAISLEKFWFPIKSPWFAIRNPDFRWKMLIFNTTGASSIRWSRQMFYSRITRKWSRKRGRRCDSLFKSMEFIFKMMEFIFKMMECTFEMMECIFRVLSCALNYRPADAPRGDVERSMGADLRWFLLRNVDFLSKECRFPIETCWSSIEDVDFLSKTCRLSVKQMSTF